MASSWEKVVSTSLGEALGLNLRNIWAVSLVPITFSP